jgi:hypothetical protein
MPQAEIIAITGRSYTASTNNKTRPSEPGRGMLYQQSTGALGARVALLQSPIPPKRACSAAEALNIVAKWSPKTELNPRWGT